ncbi:MAG TPA: biotin--[acetyl-CoA-carboxylase] ligase [Acidimicrobiales bacterium]|nr:biotin--[acetyl-CoA-carboxylase] ligase [Acidimicrobiales bacterium]
MPVAAHTRSALAASTRFGDLRHFDSIDSTNRWLREEAAAGAPEGLVAVADHQSAGRGRLGRTWEAPAGSALLMSVLLRPAHLPPERLHLVTAAVALAAADACADLAGVAAELKWPNDLLVGDRKLAGVLAEAVAGAVVVGIGVNLSAGPPGAAHLGEGGAAADRDALLSALLTGLERRLAAGWDAVATEHRARCGTVGRRVRVELADRTITGVARAVDPDGRLVVAADDGTEVAVTAGDVVHLRGAEGGAG